MNYLSVENISKSYGERVLFQDLTFGLSKGDKVALIANNGTGKTSMLKIIAGEDVSEGGKITLRKGIRVGYLNQDPQFEDQHTVKELIDASNSKFIAIINEYEAALAAQSQDYNQENIARFDAATEKMDEVDGWNYDQLMKQVLSKFRISDLTQKAKNLSGGQKKRLSLAMLLLDEPELLLLDEPTNHLDVEMIEWLERYLQQQRITLLMITHDRYFLDRVCNHILELEDGKLYHHKGNYSYFLQKRAEREEVYSTEISKASRLMKKELDWIRRSPKARTTKSKSRVTNFHKIKEKANSKKIKQELNLEVKMSRVGGKILELKKVYKSYDGLDIIKGFDYTFKKGERIGIIGENGVGKSTFLNVITQREQADSGKINTGETITYREFTQQGISIKEDKRVIDVLKDIAEVIVMADGKKVSASQFLEHFMFTAQMQYTYVSKLSGGERRRLHLLTVLIKNPNFLILDEPTNDLDLLTLNKLEEFLIQFKGCLIIVSHDRYFMDKLVDHLFVFKGGGEIQDYYCSYSEYRKKISNQKKEIKKEIVSQENAQGSVKKKRTYSESIEFDKIEKEIDGLEAQKQQIEKSLLDTNLDYDTILEKSNKLGDIIQLIEDKTIRWMELEEKGG
ncbi:MAG: ABC transporter [Crocinitomicaceae bacterium]|nr:ABC transporter [Crocinitomicaceae bacterium]